MSCLLLGVQFKKINNMSYCSNCGRRKGNCGCNDGDFLTSVIIGAATDNAIVGSLLGGSILGGVIGDAFGGDDGFF